MQMWRDQARAEVVIGSGATKSGEILAKHFVLWGLVLPAAFTGTSLSFEVADQPGGTFQALYDDLGNLVTITVAQGRSYTLPAALAAWPAFKIVSGSAEGAARTLILVAKG